MGSKVSSLNWLYIAIFSLPVYICLASEDLVKEAEEKGEKSHIIFILVLSQTDMWHT